MNVGDGPPVTAAQLSQLRHQLGNSVNHILGFSEVLAEDAEEAGQLQLVPGLQNISETTYQLIAIISERLVPERFEAEKRERNNLLFETLQLVENIRSTIGVLEKIASESGLTDVLADLVNIGRSASQLQRDLEGGLSDEPYPFELSGHQELPVTQKAKALPERSGKVSDYLIVDSETEEQARILVVDDDETNLALMARLLRSQQHEVITVDSGKGALQALAESRFDLVLLDVMMPEMDGYQVLEELNSRKLKDNLPVIVLSAISDQESAVRCIKLGAEDYLTKPVDMVLLRTKVLSSLERKRLRDREISHRRQVENINHELERRVEARVAELTESNLKLQKVETQLQNQIREMELVDQVSRIITSTLDIDQVYEEFTQELKRLVPFDRVAINLVDLEQGSFVQNYAIGEVSPVVEHGTWRPLAGTQTGEAVAAAHTLVRPDLRSDEHLASDEKYIDQGLYSCIALPLITKGVVVGTMVLRSRGVATYRQNEQSILERMAQQIAPAIQSAELFQKLEASQAEMEMADQVSRIISSTLDLDRVYEEFALELKKLIPFERAAINSVDVQNGVYFQKLLSGSTSLPSIQGLPRPLPGSLSGKVVETGATVVYSDLRDTFEFRRDRLFIEQELLSAIGVPLVLKNTVIGTLVLRSKGTGAFGDRERTILERMAQHIAPAIEKASLFEQLQASSEEMELVDQVSRIMSSTLDLEEVYGEFTEELKKLVDFERAAINLVDLESGTFSQRYVTGPVPPEGIKGLPLPLEGRLSGQVAARKATVISADIRTEQGLERNQDFIDDGLLSFIGVPLISKGNVVGTLVLRGKGVGAFGLRDQSILERMAQQIAPAVENSDLYQRLQASTEEMDLVDEIARIVTSTLDLDQVYEQFAREMKRLVTYDRLHINHIDQETGTLEACYIGGNTTPFLEVGTKRPIEDTHVRYILATGQTLVREDITDLRFMRDEYYLSQGLHSRILVPMYFQGKIIACIGLRSTRVGAYGPREQAILERLASQMASAINNATLYQSSQDARERATTALGQLEAVLETIGDGIITSNSDGRIVMVNQAACEVFGYSQEELLAKNIAVLLADKYRVDHRVGLESYTRFPESDILGKQLEMEGLRKDGTVFPLELQIRETRIGEGLYFTAALRDITERKRVEEQQRQSQKMETVGRLAGGIAHDFNNLLTPILGYGQLGARQLPEHHPTRHNLLEISKAADRAANLVHQLLAFSRQQVIEPTVFSLNNMVKDMGPMLRRLIGEDIELVSSLDANLGAVKADLGQMGQVLMNLVVNARDAMPDGGKITISTYNLPSTSDVAAEGPNLPAGDYVVFSVSDEGTGIPEDVKPHIFEPFFTTKEVDQGTGLGLATCYGIVDQSGGIIKVDTGEGKGTTIRVYLPRVDQSQIKSHEYVEEEEEDKGFESVLVVEDEDLVRGISTLVLREKGYSVVEACSGEEALEWLRGHSPGSVDILVTDMVMPRMTGAELAVQALADFPDLKVLYVSGYSEEQPTVRGALEGNIPLLRKPFSPAELAAKVREVLDTKVPVQAK